jgi:hypothetical protein
VGDAVVYHNVRFEVIKIEGNGIREAIAESLADQSSDQINSTKGSYQNQKRVAVVNKLTPHTQTVYAGAEDGQC